MSFIDKLCTLVSWVLLDSLWENKNTISNTGHNYLFKINKKKKKIRANNLISNNNYDILHKMLALGIFGSRITSETKQILMILKLWKETLHGKWQLTIDSICIKTFSDSLKFQTICLLFMLMTPLTTTTTTTRVYIQYITHFTKLKQH